MRYQLELEAIALLFLLFGVPLLLALILCALIPRWDEVEDFDERERP